jgi:hypothetical protein
LLFNAPLQILVTADWTDAVGGIAFLALLVWVLVLSVALARGLLDTETST